MRRNKYVKVIAVCGILAVLSGCAARTDQTGDGGRDYITMEEVKAAVLENAGYSEEQVRFVRIHLNTGSGAAEYEVEFLCETAEYDYTVDAKTGGILSMNFESGDYDIAAVPEEILPPDMQSGVPDTEAQSGTWADAPGADAQQGGEHAGTQPEASSDAGADMPSAGTQQGASSGAGADMPSVGTQQGASSGAQSDMPPANAQSGTEQYIGAEAAKQAALEHAGLQADEVRFKHARLELDDGRWIYDVEFHDNTTEYDYEIDAGNGAVLKFDHDTEYAQYGGNNAAAGGQISAEDAKRIALEYAGAAETEVQYLKVDYDYDDGRAEYEVEWYVGRIEYSCDVDAGTGEILSFEKESD